MSKFSEILVYLRKRSGLSQQELADKLGLSRSIIGMYESNQRMPSLEVLEALADVFNVNVDFLIGHSDDEEITKTFRTNLAELIKNTNKFDLEAAGVNLYEVDLIIKGAIPLSLAEAYQLSEQLGESMDSMLGNDLPVDNNGNGQATEFIKLFNKLSSEQQSLVIAQIKGILSNQ